MAESNYTLTKSTRLQQDEKEILRLIRDENSRKTGFNKLVTRYQEDVYWLIRRMVVNHDDADDLTQETFLKIWKNLSQFRGDSSLFTWIYRIATNEALIFLRKKKLNRLFSLDLARNNLSLSVQNTAFYHGDEIQTRFQNAVMSLPDKQRLVFNMKYYDEITFEEMSEITGTSAGALKASYHHAVKKIQKIMTTG